MGAAAPESRAGAGQEYLKTGIFGIFGINA